MKRCFQAIPAQPGRSTPEQIGKISRRHLLYALGPHVITVGRGNGGSGSLLRALLFFDLAQSGDPSRLQIVLVWSQWRWWEQSGPPQKDGASASTFWSVQVTVVAPRHHELAQAASGPREPKACEHCVSVSFPFLLCISIRRLSQSLTLVGVIPAVSGASNAQEKDHAFNAHVLLALASTQRVLIKSLSLVQTWRLSRQNVPIWNAA